MWLARRFSSASLAVWRSLKALHSGPAKARCCGKQREQEREETERKRREDALRGWGKRFRCPEIETDRGDVCQLCGDRLINMKWHKWPKVCYTLQTVCWGMHDAGTAWKFNQLKAKEVQAHTWVMCRVSASCAYAETIIFFDCLHIFCCCFFLGFLFVARKMMA